MQPPVIIVYNLDEASGFNAGTYLETYLTILNPNNNRLFQLPIRQSEEMNYFQAENICLPIRETAGLRTCRLHTVHPLGPREVIMHCPHH